jgi:hypothetical protein
MTWFQNAAIGIPWFLIMADMKTKSEKKGLWSREKQTKNGKNIFVFNEQVMRVELWEWETILI